MRRSATDAPDGGRQSSPREPCALVVPLKGANTPAQGSALGERPTKECLALKGRNDPLERLSQLSRFEGVAHTALVGVSVSSRRLPTNSRISLGLFHNPSHRTQARKRHLRATPSIPRLAVVLVEE
jgi:hypothetical protein